MYADKHTHKQQKGLYKCTYSYRNTDRKRSRILAEYPQRKMGSNDSIEYSTRQRKMESKDSVEQINGLK